MTQEEKELLLKDLCVRIPYGVKCHFKYDTAEGDIILNCIDGNVARFDYGWYGKFHVTIGPQYIKPYLRPMSSMIEEEKKEYIRFKHVEHHEWDGHGTHTEYVEVEEINNYFDWLNEHHFDYRSLIEKGLALEAPEDMYK